MRLSWREAVLPRRLGAGGEGKGNLDTQTTDKSQNLVAYEAYRQQGEREGLMKSSTVRTADPMKRN